ncbi:MAG: ABC transporter permease, partial [Bryobacteraceae bacterium]|nr:ABC transporter permease [Bryobacteraceae bacterium]
MPTRRAGDDRNFDAEIESHIALEADRLVAEGMSPSEAHAAARRAFGNVTRVRETYYESHRWLWLTCLGRDLRYGLRLLRKSPALTVAAILTISLGVGASTAVFRLVDAVLLRPLAVQTPQQLVFIDSAGAASPSTTPPYPCLASLPDRTGSFAGLAVFATDEMRVEIDGKPEPVFGQVASANYFELLGVNPALGRFMDGRDGKLNPPIAVIGNRYWQRRFNRDPGVLGKSIIVDDRIYTIAGVTPPEFSGLEAGRQVDVTIPIDTSGRIQTYAGPWWFDVIARLKPGVPASSAQAAANVVFQACMLDSDLRAEPGRPRLELHSAAYGAGTLRNRFSKPLFALMGIVVFVLLLATVNIANLLLARGIGRSREFAIRLATGASRVHIVRQLLTETLLLFTLGIIPGMILAGWGAAAVTTLFAQGRRPITLETSFNWRILAFSIAVTVMAGLLSSLFPVWRIFRTDPQQAIQEGRAQTSESSGTASIMRVLVGFQVAL